tara:strand:- start:1276 stop:1422 length:147 start_codon:yes stop_codon:yes gene_type:complete
MGYGLGFDDPEELAYYNNLRQREGCYEKGLNSKKGYPLIGITQKEWIN